jgi:thiol-disulfide isomerase/thioredoxin
VSQSDDDPTSGPNKSPDYESGWEELSRRVDQGLSFSGHERHCSFLNLGGGQFVNVSAVSGLDQIDDGRGVAIVDWDADGDLDVWVTNRTAPMIRFLRNDLRNSNSFVSVLLEGRSCNRDAVGARVELHLGEAAVLARGGIVQRFVKTVYCGRGFLSQSSRWLHFGVPPTRTVGHMTVTWPGGDTEDFTGIETGRRARLVQGSGKAKRLPIRKVSHPQTAPQSSEEVSGSARVVLYHRPRLPVFQAAGLSGEQVSSSRYSGKPLLINLWATWCRPCLDELKGWSRNADELDNHGLQVLALNVEGLNPQAEASQRRARELIAGIGFPYFAGTVDERFLEEFGTVERTLFHRIRPLALPTSLLIDASGRIAVLYRGPVETGQIVKDLKLLDVPPATLRDAAAPFPGRWAMYVMDNRRTPLTASDYQNALLNQPFRVLAAIVLLVACAFMIGSRVRRRTRVSSSPPSDSADPPG